MNRYYFIAVGLVLGVLLLGIVFAAAGITSFLDFPCLVMVVVPPGLLSLAAFPPRVVGRSFRVAFARQQAAEAELRRAVVVFRFMERSLVVSGLIGALIGVVAILSQLRDVEVQKLGQGFALLLITVFYALVLVLIVTVPFRAAVERRLAEKC
jgi:flagellar motor component MotA